MGAWALSRLPFVLLFFFPNFWVLFLAAAAYQLFSKAGLPAWIEILKQNIPKEPREHLFSLYNTLAFIEGIGLSFVIGKILDTTPESWNILFVLAALVGLSSMFFIRKIKTALDEREPAPVPKNRVLHPWKEGFKLMQTRPDFARFQLGFMIGGSALMIMAPALSMYYADTLSLSYSNITIARFAFMGLGVAFSSFIWKSWLKRFSINFMMCLVLVGFCLFPATLLLAQLNALFLYPAFIIYGIAQAGSQLIWNLSGTIFAHESDSLPFTNVNILMLGIRGCIAPFLGGALCEALGPVPVLFFGTALLVLGGAYLFAKESLFPRLNKS